jgi:hypothetical protein
MLNPLMLLGLAALGIPVLIHLINGVQDLPMTKETVQDLDPLRSGSLILPLLPDSGMFFSHEFAPSDRSQPVCARPRTGMRACARIARKASFYQSPERGGLLARAER